MASIGRIGKTIQEMRGMPPAPAERIQRYSAESYAAQYGITVEEAEEYRNQCETHQQVERMILAAFKTDPQLKAKALMLEEQVVLTEEEKALVGRARQHLGPKA